MSAIKGQNLRITIGGKYVAFATDCTLHVSAKTEDSSTKDSTGDFDENEVTGKSWDVQASALYSVDTDETGLNGPDALDATLAGEKVAITFEHTSGEKNRVADAAKGAVTYSGNAFVTDVSVKATNKQNTTYTIQLTGTGPLTKTKKA